jgi:hypothetical protein
MLSGWVAWIWNGGQWMFCGIECVTVSTEHRTLIDTQYNDTLSLRGQFPTLKTSERPRNQA